MPDGLGEGRSCDSVTAFVDQVQGVLLGGGSEWEDSISNKWVSSPSCTPVHRVGSQDKRIWSDLLKERKRSLKDL